MGVREAGNACVLESVKIKMNEHMHVERKKALSGNAWEGVGGMGMQEK